MKTVLRHCVAHRSARLILASGIAPAALLAGQACAQEAVPADAAEAAEAIVVTGSRPIAESEAAALAIQRKSDSLVTVAASDSVGRLPDQNIAQAASRLPGVGVQRDQGQARYINLRGAPKTWTTLSFNGINVVSPEGRDSRYDSIPSAIASQIIIRKAVTADMPGETIAGNVDVVTRSAFDYDGLHASGKLGGGYVELGKRQEYEGSLVLSHRIDTGIGQFGFLASGSYYQRDMVTDNFETDWEQVSQDRQPGAADRVWARETENKLYRLTRKNYSASGRIDWKSNDGDSRIYAESIYSAFSDDEMRDNYIFDLDDRQSDNTRGAAACTITSNPNPRNSGYADVCIGNTPLTGTVYGIDINQRATLRAYRQSVFTNTLAGDHDLSDTWKLGWRLNYTRSKDDRSVVGEARFDSPSTRNLRPTVAYDLTDPQLARVALYRTIASGGAFSAGAPVTSIDDFTRSLSSLTSLDAVDITDAYTAKLDLKHDMALFGGEVTLAFGGQYDRRTKESNESQLSITNAQAAAAGIPTTFNPAWALTDRAFKGKIPLGYSFSYFSEDAMRENIEKARAIAPYVPLTENYYNVREQVYAAYAMATSRFDWGSIIAGARVEHVKNDGRAIVTLDGAQTPISVLHDRTMVFPSVHINYDVASDKKLRLGFTTGAARPDYDQLRPNFTYSDSDQTVSGGNPDAKPERAYGFDGYFEWYVQPQGYVMLGAFYKKAKDVLFDSTRTFNLDVLNTGGVDRSQYVFSTITNGGSGYIYGMEAAVQQQLDPFVADLGLPEWMGGFGISANITLNRSKATKPDGTKVRFPGTSDAVYNIGGYYEKYGASIRLNYQRRSAWIDEILPATDGGDAYWAADDELDFSARYAINRNVEIYVDASNLLNGAGRRYTGASIYTIEWERFGRRYTGGVRVNF
jgi:TonB-dependent receptor